MKRMKINGKNEKRKVHEKIKKRMKKLKKDEK